MSTATTRSGQATSTLHLAFDLGNRLWKLAFATSIAHAPRLRTMPARELAQLDAEIAAAKARFGLAPDAAVVSCYEAGRREERRQQLRAELVARLDRVRGPMSEAEFDDLVSAVERTAARFAEIDARAFAQPRRKPDA